MAGVQIDGVNNIIKADTISEVTSANGVAVDGVTLKDGQVDLADSKKILLGTGDDLQLYHDGSNSVIKDAGTGNLRIENNGAGVYLINTTDDVFVGNFGGWLNVMKQYKLVSTAGAWYTFTRTDGSEVKFLSKDFEKKLDELDGLKDEIYQQICDAYILQYKPGEDFGIDDVEIDEEFVSEEG